MSFVNERAQPIRIRSDVPAMVAGELPLRVGHERALVRAQLAHEVHQVVEGIAFDVELRLRPSLEHLVQRVDIVGADVPRVGPGVHRDPSRTCLQARLRRARDAGYAQVARVADQRHLVQVDGERGACGSRHSDCRSISICRVRSVPTPQW